MPTAMKAMKAMKQVWRSPSLALLKAMEKALGIDRVVFFLKVSIIMSRVAAATRCVTRRGRDALGYF